ncbi:glycosyltransferase [Caenispirillum bisanense]|uniref:Cellulose synthase (UDP-forming) n=1 Tax=Caenispirillum bisanense TaxID=414052 RepID=A0A286GSV0_9PROT|nr:cellulose synthase catalytic subunit [Caenispirillum bisanense]SOD98542.1 cellulose synthase (UDP-forming) [Caenispirillum bisanense]
MLALTETQSALVHLVVAAAMVVVFTTILRPERNAHRVVMFGLASFFALRYIAWRATETLAPFGATWDCVASWSFFLFECGALLSSLSAFLILSRTKSRSAEADAHAQWWSPRRAPKVAVLIATYNEDRSILERTLAGASALDYPDVDVYVLDDGRREWLSEFAAAYGARHVMRPDNTHAKAGNINHALRMLLAQDEPPDFVAVLDADFVPHSDFLTRTLALFHEQDVGLVQTPQHFFNPDPVQYNLGLQRSYPDEQRFFFDHLQPSRDAWGIAVCCGTSSVIRTSALADVGLFPTDSVTEDFLLTLVLKNAGYRTVYLAEPVTEGLAPEGLKEYVTQRARWCLGQMQILRGRLGPFRPNALSLADRWSMVDAMLYWTLSFPFRVAALVYPILYWYFNIIVVNADVPDVLTYFGVYFVFVLGTMNFISGGLIVPLVHDVSQLLGAFPIMRAAAIGLVRPHGHPFKVTAKGGDRTRTVVQWTLMRPFMVLFSLTAGGLLIGLFSPSFAFADAGDGKAVILFWTLVNLLVLALVMMACVELPRSERHLVDLPDRVGVEIGGEQHVVWMRGLTPDGARLRGIVGRVGEPLRVSIERIGVVPGVVAAVDEGGIRASLQPDQAQRTAILRHLYGTGSAPGVVKSSSTSVFKDFVIRLRSGRP